MSNEIKYTRRRETHLSKQKSDDGLLLGMSAGPSALGPLQGLDQRSLPTGFERWRSELDHLSGMKLLDALTEPVNAPACIQTLPVEDLHRYLYEIGLEDAEAVLALTSSEQVKALLDFEVWDRHELVPTRLDSWLFALLRAGNEILYQRVLELDDSLLAWVMKSNAYAFVIDDPDDFDPPNAEHFLTPDRRLCVVFPRSSDHLEEQEKKSLEEAVGLPKSLSQDDQGAPLGGGSKDLPARVFIDMLMQEQPEFCIHLLLASTAALYTQLHEDAYRWRTARMSDLGFVEYYQAKEIYTAPPHDWKRTLPAQRIDPDRPPAKKWLAQVIASNLRLDRAFASLSWEDAVVVAEQLGYVANMALSSDHVSLWDRDQQKITLQRLQAGLTIALEVLNGPNTSAMIDAESLAKHHINHLFRLGYEKMIEAAKPVWRVEKALQREGDASAALDGLPHLKTWADGLLGQHPEGRGESGEVSPLTSLSDCTIAKEGALIIEDLVRVSQPLYAQLLNDIMNDVEMARSPQGGVAIGPLLIAAYYYECVSTDKVGVLRPLRLEEAIELHRYCFEPVEVVISDVPLYAPLRQEAKSVISEWWNTKGGQTETAPLALLRELREQMSSVISEQLDIRFVPLLWSDEQGDKVK